MKKILLTGNDGYIGSVMTNHLVRQGYDVRGLDTKYFHPCLLGQEPVNIPYLEKDVRAITPSDIEGYDAIIHLAALSNDPIGNLNAGWTEDINLKATINLARIAKQAGCPRFLFASSCIMYGLSGAEWVDESSPLDPQTEYARSKVAGERALSELAGDGFSPTFIRNGTVYGLSPRMRLDTVLNNLVAAAVTTGRVIVHSDGQPWRPVIHVKDVVRTFQTYLEAPIEVVHNQAFNNGADHLNYQIRRLAEIAVEVVPGATLEIQAQASADQRTYKASFAKFARTFPDFRFEWTPETGARELADAFRAVNLTREDVESGRYVRLQWLQQMMRSGKLDDELRWKA